MLCNWACRQAELVPLRSMGTEVHWAAQVVFSFGSSFVTAHWAGWKIIFQTGLERKLFFQLNLMSCKNILLSSSFLDSATPAFFFRYEIAVYPGTVALAWKLGNKHLQLEQSKNWFWKYSHRITWSLLIIISLGRQPLSFLIICLFNTMPETVKGAPSTNDPSLYSRMRTHSIHTMCC